MFSSELLLSDKTELIILCFELLVIIFFLLLHRALWNLYIVQSPTNALFIKLGKVYIYTKIHIIIAPTCFGLRPSSGSLLRAWLNLHFC